MESFIEVGNVIPTVYLVMFSIFWLIAFVFLTVDYLINRYRAQSDDLIVLLPTEKQNENDGPVDLDGNTYDPQLTIRKVVIAQEMLEKEEEEDEEDEENTPLF